MTILYKGIPTLKPNGDMYQLTSSLSVVYKDSAGNIKAVLVPEGYLTDGASIPRILWEEVGSPFDPRFMTAAIVHDWHCNIRDNEVPSIHKDSISVDEMSTLFFELLRHDGVGKLHASAMEKAVRIYKTIF